MTDEKQYNACLQPQGHREHLCVLMERGQAQEVRRRAAQAAFRCRNCDCSARHREDLCNPVPIEK